MRLPGRVAAAIEILADIEVRHRPASEALRDWGLSHRFAGAGDRAAIGNLVYDALRRRSSLAWRIGSDEPRALALATAIVEWGEDPEALNAAFAEDRHAPEPIPPETIARLAAADLAAAPDHVRADVPEWLVPEFRRAFPETWVEEGAALAMPPPLDLRVNTLRADRAKIAQQLARLGAGPTRLSPVGLRIPPVAGGRRHPNVQAEEAFRRGRVEVQDEGSQLCALVTGARPGEQVLDLCAGAGGKTLALAAAMDNHGQVFAYDSDRTRLAPIFERLKRSSVRNVQVRAPRDGALDDLVGRMDRVLVDAPCTGIGVWRRRPDAKWRLGPDALARRVDEQRAVLDQAAGFVRPGGLLAYATCSLLEAENGDQVRAFLERHPDFALESPEAAWREIVTEAEPPLHGDLLLLSPYRTATDGFVLALLRRR